MSNFCPTFSVTVDVVIMSVVDGQLMVLLVQRQADPYKDAWALPGGFKQPDESLDTAAFRELREETGIDVAHQSAEKEELSARQALEDEQRARRALDGQGVAIDAGKIERHHARPEAQHVHVVVLHPLPRRVQIVAHPSPDPGELVGRH